MSFVSKEKIRPGAWQVTAKIEAEAFTAKVDEIFAEEMPKLVIPGFRKGKAPRAMLERRYGANLFFEDALDALLPDAVEEAVKAAELELALRAQDLDVKEIGKENGVTLLFTAIVKGEASIEGWKGLEVPCAEPVVTEEDVDGRIEQLRRRNARIEEVEGRPARLGDIAQIDYLGLLDDEPFEGGSAENHDLELGSGSFIPGFEELIVGHSPGEEFDIDLTFPEQYHSEALAGKAVVFKITLHALKCEELPEVDDDFAQEVGESYDNVEDMRAGIRAELLEARVKELDETYTRTLQDKLAAMAVGEVADELFARRSERNIEAFAERIGVSVEQYLQYVGLDQATFEADMLERAKEQLLLELALEDIARQEGLEASAEEIDAECERLAAEYDVEVARVKFAVPESEIVAGLLREKALEIAKEAAVKVEPSAIGPDEAGVAAEEDVDAGDDDVVEAE